MSECNAYIDEYVMYILPISEAWNIAGLNSQSVGP